MKVIHHARINCAPFGVTSVFEHHLIRRIHHAADARRRRERHRRSVTGLLLSARAFDESLRLCRELFVRYVASCDGTWISEFLCLRVGSLCVLWFWWMLGKDQYSSVLFVFVFYGQLLCISVQNLHRCAPETSSLLTAPSLGFG